MYDCSKETEQKCLGYINTSYMRQDHTKIVLKAVGYEGLQQMDVRIWGKDRFLQSQQ
jgi:hypothetical protein